MKNFDNSKPIYLQLKEIIEKAILSGAIAADEIIPSNRNVAKEYQLNPQTVSKAMHELLQEGYLYRKRGIGLFVKKGAQEDLQKRLMSDFRENRMEEFFSEAFEIGIKKEELQKSMDKIYGEEK